MYAKILNQLKKGNSSIMDYEKLLYLRRIAGERILEFLKEDSFELSIDYLKYIHESIFHDLLESSGVFRTCNLTRSEEILNGDTVIYADYHNIESYLNYDLSRQINKKYSQVEVEKLIKDLAHFTSNIWQTHSFNEGNTRTISIFIVKYLRYLGYQVNNDIFKDHSLYYRNSLVLSSYYNPKYNITNNYLPLNNFYRKVLLDNSISLDNDTLYQEALFNNNKPKIRTLK